jgi:hypothetical protein
LGEENHHTVSLGGLTWIEHPLLGCHFWLLHAFSTRLIQGLPASLNLGFTPVEPRTRVQENRKLFLQKLGAQRFVLADLQQVHSAMIYQVFHQSSGGLGYRLCGSEMLESSGAGQPAGDALISDQTGILLSVRIADCLPVLLVDPQHRAVAAVHTGWRGALARVVENTVGELRRVYGSEPQNLLALMGPSIRACCYEVGPEVVEAFERQFAHSDPFFRKLAHRTCHLDLVAVARYQLLAAGLSPDHLAAVDFCTACRTDLFYSYRREGGSTGRMMAVIGIYPH